MLLAFEPIGCLLLQLVQALGVLHAALMRVWAGVIRVLSIADTRGRTSCTNGLSRLQRILTREVRM